VTPEELASLIRSTLLDAAAAGRISIDPAQVPDPVTVERPRVREHGDWSTNVAMQLGKKAGMAPREFAQILADDLAAADGIDSIEVAGPGFISIRLGAGAGRSGRDRCEAPPSLVVSLHPLPRRHRGVGRPCILRSHRRRVHLIVPRRAR